MNFRQRLIRYLFGVLIGLILCGIFFKDQAHIFTSWLPAQRVKDEILRATWTMDEQAARAMECLNMDEEALREELDDADVDFSGSETKSEPRIYLIHLESGNDVRIAISGTLVSIKEASRTDGSPCSE
jgi:hypothetical protein